ncbi:23S rRNA (uracil(1939)-C(5))-methyltransferase RlmD [Lachnospiraceae bacterium C1.1]|nr:23S rRNA (uracil(1939)-C(5))-methyltransferase RlmD [Lachnospiraceae bacterium C1.1]
MKRKTIIRGKVVDLLFPNKGIVETPEGNAHVKGVIPGQTISFVVKRNRPEYAEGRLQEIIERSELETADPCPHFEKCGGCSYQTLPYETQTKIKSEQVKKLLSGVFDRFENSADENWFEGIIKSPKESEYRNKMEFSFGNEVIDGPLELGMHKAGRFNDVISVENCRIVDEDFRSILSETLEFFKSRNIPFYRRSNGEGYLRHLLVRKGTNTGEIIVDIVTSSAIDFDFTEYVDLLKGLDFKGELVGVLHTTGDSTGDAVDGSDTELLWGRDYFYDELLGLRFKITPFSFFQTNTLGAELLYKKAREYALSGEDGAEKGIIFDLYSGTGTIAQMMAAVAKKVVGVEIVEEAVEAAKVNAELNKLENTEFIAGDVLKCLDEVEEKPDLIIMDPPRAGAAPKALEKILAYGVERIVYISCKASSLAFDLEAILNAGYRVKKVCCVDMFPSTSGVETVVLLSQQRPDDHIEIEINLDEIDATSAESKATYKEIEEWVQEHYGFHVTNLNIAQVKQKHGIIERENYNKPKSENSRQPGCPKEKVKAIEDAMRHFQMIK